MNKKAIDSLVENIFAAFLIIVILLSMWLFLTYEKISPGQPKEYVINAEVAGTNQISLLNYLRTDTELDINNDKVNETLQNADVIALSFSNSDLDQQLKENINNFFQASYGTWWHMTIENKDKKLEFGHNYNMQMTTTTLFNIVTKKSFLPPSKSITTEQEIPAIDNSKINIKFTSWVILV